MTTTYRITQRTTGVILDEIEGDTPLDAYRAHMARVGYPTEADAQSAGYTLAEIPADMEVEPRVSYRPSSYSYGDRVRGNDGLVGRVVGWDKSTTNRRNFWAVQVEWDNGTTSWMDDDDLQHDKPGVVGIVEAIFG